MACKSLIRSRTGQKKTSGITSVAIPCLIIHSTTNPIRQLVANRAHGRSSQAKMYGRVAGGGKIRNRKNAACMLSMASWSGLTSNNERLIKSTLITLRSDYEYSRRKNFIDAASNRHLDWLESE